MRQNEPPLILWEAAVLPSARQPAPPQASRTSNNIWDDWFCLRWTIRRGAVLLHPPSDAHQHSSCALRSGEAASPDLGGQRKCWCTLWSRRPTPSRSCRTSCGRQRTVIIFNAFYFFKLMFFKFYLETKWVLSGEKATLRTQDPCPLSVPARLACCL